MNFIDFLAENLGEPKENTIGESRFCCPFCGETKYKFYINTSQGKKNNLYHCKKCDAKGNPITFIKEYFNVSGKEAYDILESRDITIDKYEMSEYNNKELTEDERLLLMLRGVQTANIVEKKVPPKLPLGFKLLKDNINNPEAYPYLQYLYNRGITVEQIFKHNIAYIVEGNCYKSDGETLMPLRKSVIFFTYNSKGNYVYWNTRSIEKNPLVKSINAPSNDLELGKRDVIFNLNIASTKNIIVITEGVFDALTFHDYGVATFGKQVSEEQIALFRKMVHEDTYIYVMLDSDAIDNNVSLASKLYMTHKNVYVVPHSDKDANDLGTVEAFKVVKENRIHASPEGLQSYYLQQKLLQWS